jgi:mRNA-degrading endonuclease RelE of RelBE toxin-antitoxin system
LKRAKQIALKCFDALEHELLYLIANNPHAFSHFHETGAPYRAKLFKLARTTYWIVYTIDDAAKTVDVLRFWNSAREP